MTKQRYVVEKEMVLPDPDRGRRKNITNDAELIQRGLEGIRSGKYKNYSEAARSLQPEAMTYYNGVWKQVVDKDTIIKRLQRAIGKEYSKQIS